MQEQAVLTREQLVDLLAGEAYEPPCLQPCYHCRGTGKVQVGPGRGGLYDCPMCRGKGVRNSEH